jgi:HNH endonuclease
MRLALSYVLIICMRTHNETYNRMAAIRRRDGDNCWVCGLVMRFVNFAERRPRGTVARIDATLDHVIKREHGGSRHLSNLRLAHAYCNTARHTNPADVLRAAMSGPICDWLGRPGLKDRVYVVAMRRHGDWWRSVA